jgi:hypothetical protein
VAERRVLEFEAAAVGDEADCLKGLDPTELLFVEAASDLEPTA